MSRALSLCPELIIVPSRHVKYSEVSRAVMTHLNDITPLVEQISIDEAFLDVTGRSEPAEHLARALQKTINEEQGLPCSLGVATNKLVAKIANNIGKAEKRSAQPPNCSFKCLGCGAQWPGTEWTDVETSAEKQHCKHDAGCSCDRRF